MNRPCRQLILFTLVITLASPLMAQPPERGQGFRGGRGPGAGPGQGQGFGRGPGGPGHGPGQGHGPHAQDARHDEDHEVFQFLLTNHKKIKRTVKNLPNGVETITESDDPKVASMIQEHVVWMQDRVEKINPIRMRDPLFRELFRHADKIKMQHTDTEKGVRVVETSEDPKVAKLIQAHAEVVSGFVARGFDEAMKNHPVPGNAATTDLQYTNPRIANYGKVVPLPDAAHQPRPRSRIVVDVTKGGDPESLYPAIEKIARFVNIYHGAGEKPQDVSIAVILHGDATLAALNADAYRSRFKTDANPNLDCLHQLHEAGVEISVCGQSLVSKGGKPEEVAVFVDVAVSALTSLVNLQTDGYAYVPLK